MVVGGASPCQMNDVVVSAEDLWSAVDLLGPLAHRHHPAACDPRLTSGSGSISFPFCSRPCWEGPHA